VATETDRGLFVTALVADPLKAIGGDHPQDRHPGHLIGRVGIRVVVPWFGEPA